MITKQQKINFIKVVYPAAKDLYNSNPAGQLDPFFVTAQAACETGYNLNQKAKNNIFGITKGSWTGDVALALTNEYFATPNKTFVLPEKIVSVTKIADKQQWKYSVYRLFRVYDSLSKCLDDHLAILKKAGYADAWPFKDNPVEYAKRISDYEGSRYATEPNYANILAGFIREVESIVKEKDL